MSRLLFVKEGPAVWSSHLDLMRALMRSFRRAGIELKHSQGFTPHPELSILMPLSVGVESQCELAEFALAEGCQVPAAEIAARLDPVLPAGIRAIESYEGGQKAGKLAWLRARLTLEYEATGNRQQATDPLVGAVIGRPSSPASDEAAGDGDQASVTSHQSPDPLVGAVIGRPSFPTSDEATGNGQQATGDGGNGLPRPSGPRNDRGWEKSVGGGALDAPQSTAAVEATGNGQQATGDGGNGLPRPSGPRNDRVEAIQALFARPSLVVEKHSKKGPVETDIAPMIREITVRAAETSPACRGTTVRGTVVDFIAVAPATLKQLASFGRGPASRPVEGCLPSAANAFSEAAHSSVVIVEAVVAAQNPTLNPLLLVTAIETYLPQYKPDRVLCRRLEIYDADLRPFR